MDTECYKDVVIDCAELLERAKTVESNENKEAVRMAGQVFPFAGLEMKRTDAAGAVVMEPVSFLETDQMDRSRVKEYSYEEEDGTTVTYTVYPQMGQPEWSERQIKWLGFFVMQLHEVYKRQNLTQDAHYYRYHDPQTKHTNMAYFSERCAEHIQDGTISAYTAICANLSGFTNLNLEIGSDNCDTALIRFMDWLKTDLEADEVVSRISGDQFALLIHQDHEEMILDKLRASVIRYGEKEHEVVTMSALAGIYRLTADAENYHHIIQAISSALNTAKNSVQLQFAYYDPVSADAAEKKKFYEEAFQQALHNGDIHVFFQPKVSLKDYELIGAEALSRWIMDGQIVPPDAFIPILEATSRICELDFYVLEQVCISMHDWIKDGVKPVKVSVNFSRRHLSNKNLVNDIVRILDKYEVPHEYIEVELTETTIDADFAALKQIVRDLRERGIESSVDDFGMGYSSLSLIRDVPFKVLKIDKSFLGDKSMQSDERQRAMMKHVINMANDLGMECIAEGVESMEHVQLLKENKCYMAQGFLFNRPIPKEQFETILMKS